MQSIIIQFHNIFITKNFNHFSTIECTRNAFREIMYLSIFDSDFAIFQNKIVILVYLVCLEEQYELKSTPIESYFGYENIWHLEKNKRGYGA